MKKLHPGPFGGIVPPVGWQPPPDNLTKVSPSAQADIKINNQVDRLRSSTIAASLRLPAASLESHAANSLNYFTAVSVLPCQASTDDLSTETPGPIVDETVSFFRYAPFADAGFAFLRSVSSVSRFSFNAGTSKSARPIGQ